MQFWVVIKVVKKRKCIMIIRVVEKRQFSRL